jgi:predicted DNA-binding transcriptional regulator AlpA
VETRTTLEKEERLLTIDEVAEFLRINPMTVKIGKVWRFRKTEINEWLKKQKYKK